MQPELGGVHHRAPGLAGESVLASRQGLTVRTLLVADKLSRSPQFQDGSRLNLPAAIPTGCTGGVSSRSYLNFRYSSPWPLKLQHAWRAGILLALSPPLLHLTIAEVMDLQALLVFLGGCVLCSVVGYLVTVLGAKEQVLHTP